ncbi:hypothetical protein DPMN_180030 [Dreissena polymorpha]|uniref:Uncharacterized protein n=1 Tax=Dreissena polymorpha TaxID=45954 RepID=A0A9D4IP14_DREPO|nr:hypothetical protein DPMN_180030 [Dreissena polymorpha]
MDGRYEYDEVVCEYLKKLNAPSCDIQCVRVARVNSEKTNIPKAKMKKNTSLTFNETTCQATELEVCAKCE